MVSDWLGIEFDQIRLEQGDTAQIGFGRGTYASRSMTVGGSALRKAADDVIETGRKFAAHILEAAADDIEFKDGVFVVAGTDKSIPLVQVARASFRPMGNPIELGIGLEGIGAFAANSPSFPNGCHICEVEIDPETGIVKLDRYAVVDDIGLVLNPLLAEGQIHGGIVQGVGQALHEHVIHDDDGQLLTGSYMDYNMPKADDVPFFASEMHEVLCKTNPIGVKGCGEGGTVGATPAVMSAILDALAPLGVDDLAMPATPNTVWKAIQNAI
jgi:carbon-monoxide dehydrogenase large subunit